MKLVESSNQSAGAANDGPPLALMVTPLAGDRALVKVKYAGTLFHSGIVDPGDDSSLDGFVTDVVNKTDLSYDLTVNPDDVWNLLEAAVVDPPEASEPLHPAAVIDTEDLAAGTVVAPDDPWRLARIYLRECHHHDDRPALVTRGDTILAWTGRCYVEHHDVSKDLTASIQSEFARLNREEVQAHALADKASRTPTMRKVGTTLVTNAKQALTALVRVPAEQLDPSWLIEGTEADSPAREMVAFPNALVHLPSYLAGEEFSQKPTPNYFSTRCLPFNFDPVAAEPVQWLGFLDQLWGSDSESIGTLQEWFGYCLTPDTSLQKILMVIGPSRSGKGTIARVLTALLGQESVAGPSLTSLSTQFGIQSMIGRTLAIIPDARLSGRADQSAIVERMLSISGEDRVEVDRKHRTPWTGTLPTRLMLLSNELPRLRDASMALANRLVILSLRESFLGKEDRHLTARLVADLPGIFLWAAVGWERLNDRGHFLMPSNSQELVDDLKAIASPVAQFVYDRCLVGSSREVTVEALYAGYREWCETQGSLSILDRAVFGRDLRAVLPTIKNLQHSAGGNRQRYYAGISLTSSATHPIDRGF